MSVIKDTAEDIERSKRRNGATKVSILRDSDHKWLITTLTPNMSELVFAQWQSHPIDADDQYPQEGIYVLKYDCVGDAIAAAVELGMTIVNDPIKGVALVVKD